MTRALEDVEGVFVAEEARDADQQILVERVQLARVGAQLVDVAVEVERCGSSPGAARCGGRRWWPCNARSRSPYSSRSRRRIASTPAASAGRPLRAAAASAGPRLASCQGARRYPPAAALRRRRRSASRSTGMPSNLAVSVALAEHQPAGAAGRRRCRATRRCRCPRARWRSPAGPRPAPASAGTGRSAAPGLAADPCRSATAAAAG